MAGRTSDVTHRLNFFAVGSFDERIREYSPDSLIRSPFVPLTVNESFTVLSSSSTWSRIAFCGLLYPRISATSFPTKYGLPFTSIVRTLPNSAFSKTCTAFFIVHVSFASSHIKIHVFTNRFCCPDREQTHPEMRSSRQCVL